MKLSYKQIKEILNYDPITGIFVWKPREITIIQDKTWNKKHAGKKTGNLKRSGYRSINIKGKEYQCSWLAWILTYKSWPKNELDHINGNRSDDRISNLRKATRSENAINRTTQSNNTSGYKGVWKRKGLNRWVAEIMKDRKKIRIGSFKSPEAAHAAYLLSSKKIHGEYAKA